MKLREVKKLVEGTADPAFALDGQGRVAAWNAAAENMFGITQQEALGSYCSDLLHGRDECGRECTRDCTVNLQALRGVPLKSYDIRVNVKGEPRWFSMAVTAVSGAAASSVFTVHIARSVDIQKRFENVLRDFVAREADLPEASVAELFKIERAPSAEVRLTSREQEVLRLLSEGRTSAAIADMLFISRTTVNNHVQHILKKLNAKTRLEAVRRAEQARLI
ncbi:MAG TPA: LuxR C-terminal-related transcriptional regulator [Pyrinomonadaceae bacterium]|nr:LuxR C-terminal-related transcriptional regulator [Pyrinomonadaceae bacterium]